MTRGRSPTRTVRKRRATSGKNREAPGPALTDTQIAMLHSSGKDTATLADLVGMPHEAFLKRYRDVLASAAENAAADLQAAILDLATQRMTDLEFVLLAQTTQAASKQTAATPNPDPNAAQERRPIHLHFDAIDAAI